MLRMRTSDHNGLLTVFSTLVIYLLCLTGKAAAFSIELTTVAPLQLPLKRVANSRRYRLCINALSERQMQFWEDVDDGLDDIADFWTKKGLDIDRIRTFTKRARGELPLPEPSSPGHEPSEEHIDGLTSQPFWNIVAQPELFPWARDLELSAPLIQKEYESRLAESLFATDSVWQNQVMGTGWSAIRLQRLGVWNTENCEKFPVTFNIIKSFKIPLAVRGVCFARQTPGSGVQPHSDGRNFILTSHLGLSIPKGCWIEVGGVRKEWEEGKLTTLDTSFTHATSNPSNSDRHVLIIDFWHPELSPAEKSALEFIYDLRNKFESGKVPFRKPRSLKSNENGLASLWSTITGGS